jgi:hypothetical protein
LDSDEMSHLLDMQSLERDPVAREATQVASAEARVASVRIRQRLAQSQATVMPGSTTIITGLESIPSVASSEATPHGHVIHGHAIDQATAVFNAIKQLYLNSNRGCDRRIAERLTLLYRDAVAEGEKIQTGSVMQFAEFFIAHDWMRIPKVTLTPDGTIRVRWIAGKGNFIAIEFTGAELVKVVAEVPRGDGHAQYFANEDIKRVARFGRDIGARFG